MSFSNPPLYDECGDIVLTVPDDPPDSDQSFKTRLLRGQEKLKRAHWEQLEKYLPALPCFKLSSRNSVRKPPPHFNVEDLVRIDAYLPTGMDKFVPQPGDGSTQLQKSKNVIRIPKMKALRLKTIATSTTARALMGVAPEPPAIDKKKDSFSRTPSKIKITDTNLISKEQVATGPVVDEEALKKLYSNGDSTPSERIGSFYSLRLGTLSPVRLYMEELSARRQRKCGSVPPKYCDSDPPLMQKLTLNEKDITSKYRTKTEGFLPLELFDSESDRLSGEAFILQHDRYTCDVKWLSCTVLSRDSVSLYYRVKYSQTVTTSRSTTDIKSVSRLISRYQLRFPDESPEDFHSRLFHLRQQRKKAEQELRTELLLSLMVDDADRGLSDSTIASIINKSAGRMKPCWRSRISQYLNQVCEEHLYSIRKVRLQYHLLSPAFRLQLLPIDISLCDDSVTDDWGIRILPYEKCNARKQRYNAARDFISQRCLQMTEPTQSVLLKVRETWTAHSTVSLVKIAPDNTPDKAPRRYIHHMLPIQVFTSEQKTHCDLVRKKVLLRWKADLESALLGVMGKKYRGNYHSEQQYQQSSFAVFLKLIKYQMSVTLRDLVSSTVAEYISYLEASVRPIGPSHRLGWDLGYYTNPGTPPVLPKNGPLLTIELDVIDGNINLRVSLDEAKDMLHSVVDNILSAAGTIPVVESTLLSAMKLKLSYVNVIDSNDPEIEEVRFRINNIISICSETIVKLRQSYLEFEEFLSSDDPYFSFNPGSDTNTSTVRGKIDELIDVRNRIVNTSSDGVHCHLFYIDCSPVKQKLVASVNISIDRIISSVRSMLSNISHKACQLYGRLWSELQLRPATPETLNTFRSSTAGMRLEMLRVEEHDFSLVDRWRTDLLEYYMRGLTDEESDRLHSMRTWPVKIRACLEQSDKLLKQEEEEFVRQLERAKKTLKSDIEGYRLRVFELSQLCDYEQTEVAAGKASEVRQLLEEALTRAETCCRHGVIFGLVKTEFPEIEKLLTQVVPFCRLWKTAHRWLQHQSIVGDTPLEQLDAAKTGRLVAEWHVASRISVRALRGYPKPQSVAKRLELEVAGFHKDIPWILQLSLSDLRHRHWKLLVAELGGAAADGMDVLTVSNLLSWGIADHTEFVSRIALQAKQEWELEHKLESMKAEWREYRLQFSEWSGCKIIAVGPAHDLLAVIDKHLMITQLTRVDEFIAPFEKAARDWETVLLLLQEIIMQWLAVQTSWLSLKPIFDNTDVCASIGQESRRFHLTHKQWVNIMKEAEVSSKLLILATAGEDLLPRLKDVSLELTKVQRGLSSFIEVRRRLWPRLYWLADNEILRMLSAGRDLHTTSTEDHLSKCFEGISRLGIEDGCISTMISPLGECVPLLKKIKTNRDSLDNWLHMLETHMCDTLRHLLKEALHESQRCALVPWIFAWPHQIVLLALKVQTNIDIIDVLRLNGKRGLTALRVKITKTLRDLTKLLYVKGTMPDAHIRLVESTLLLHLTFKDQLDNLLEAGVESTNNIAYELMLKHTFQGGKLVVNMMHISIDYQYEYLNVKNLTVHTPTTERIQKSIFCALQLRSSGVVVASNNKSGISGKTEIIRDLAKQIGIRSVSVECSASLEWGTLLNALYGTIAIGAWCIFDHIESLPCSVMGLLAPCLSTLYHATAQKKPAVALAVDPAVGDVATPEPIIINMNFVIAATFNSKKHGKPIPSCIRDFFRIAAIYTPDLQLIFQHLLYVAGCIQNSESLARKGLLFLTLANSIFNIPETLILCKRINKSISALSNQKYTSLNAQDDLGTALYTETRWVTTSIQFVLRSYICDSDVDKFDSLLGEVFDTAVTHHSKSTVPSEMLPNLKNVSKIPFFYVSETVIAAITSLAHQQSLHNITVVCGEVGCGKTSLISAIASCYPTQSQPMLIPVVPGTMSISSLCGKLNSTDGRWEEGVIPRILSKIRPSTPAWIVLDCCSLDFSWMGGRLTTLLSDDVYCCNSGERISLSTQGKIILETETLSHADPGIISKAGFAFISNVLDWRLVFKKTIEQGIASGTHTYSRPTVLSESCLLQLYRLAEIVIPQLEEFCSKTISRNYMDAAPSILVKCQRVALLYLAIVGQEVACPDEDAQRCLVDVPLIHSATVVFSLGIPEKSYQIYTDKIISCIPVWSSLLAATTRVLPLDLSPLECYPFEGKWLNLTDHALDDALRLTYTGVSVIDTFYHPSPEIIRCAYLFEILNRNTLALADKPPASAAVNSPQSPNLQPEQISSSVPAQSVQCAIIGGVGTGKSRLLQLLAARAAKTNLVIHTSMYDKCTGTRFQQHIELRMSKRRQGVIGPPLGKQCLLVVDDVHKPGLGQHSEVSEMMVALVKYGSFFHVHSADPVKLADVALLISQDVNCQSRRVTGNFFPLHLYDSLSSSFHISLVSTPISNWIGKFGGALSQQLSEIIVSTYSILKEKFKGCVPKKGLYFWHTQDMMNIVSVIVSHSRSKFSKKHTLLSLLAYEIQRSLGSRLGDPSDVVWLDKAILNIMGKVMRIQFSDSVAKPSELSFSSIGNIDFTTREGFGLDTTSYQVTPEELTKIAQAKSDQFIEYSHQRALSTESRPKGVKKCIAGLVKSAVPSAVDKIRKTAKVDFVILPSKKSFYIDQCWARILNSVVRALRQPRSHAMIISDQGSCVMELITFAAYILNMDCQILSAMGKSNWKAQLTAVIKAAAVQKKKPSPQSAKIEKPRELPQATPTDGAVPFPSLLGTTTKAPTTTEGSEPPSITLQHILWVVSESCLTESCIADLCCIISGSRSGSGINISGIISNEAGSLIHNSLLEEASGELLTYAAEKITNNLRFVLVCEDRTDSLSRWRREFPSINLLTVIYSIQKSSFENLEELATHTMKGELLNDFTDKEFSTVATALASCYNLIVEIQKSDTTDIGLQAVPRSFRQYVCTYCRLYSDRNKELQHEHKRTKSILLLLQAAEFQGEKYSRDARSLEPQLLDTEAEGNKLRSVIDGKTELEKSRQADFEELEVSCLNQVEQHTLMKSECESLLIIAVPALQKAKQDLLLIDEKHIAAIKFLSTPAAALKKVVECLCVILGEKIERTSRGGTDAGWAAAQRVLDDPIFIKRLMNVNADRLSTKTVDYISDCTSLAAFRPAKLKAISPAAEKLCDYVLKLHQYLKTMQVVIPKQQILLQDDATIREVIETMESKRDVAVSLRREIEATHRKLTLINTKHDQIKSQRETCLKRTENASSLCEHLEDYLVLWNEEYNKMSHDLKNLSGNCLSAATLMTYFPCTDSSRRRYEHNIIETVKEHFPVTSLNSESDDLLTSSILLAFGHKENCKRHGSPLPYSKATAEFEYLVLKNTLCPVVVEFHGGLFLSWLQYIYAGNEVIVIQDFDQNAFTKLKHAMTRGERSPIVVYEIFSESISIDILPYILIENGRSHVLLNDAPVEPKPGFRLFLTRNVPHTTSTGVDWYSSLPTWFLEATTKVVLELSGQDKELRAALDISPHIDCRIDGYSTMLTAMHNSVAEHSKIELQIVNLLYQSSLSSPGIGWIPSDGSSSTDRETILDEIDLITEIIDLVLESATCKERLSTLQNSLDDCELSLKRKCLPISHVINNVQMSLRKLSVNIPLYVTGYSFLKDIGLRELGRIHNQRKAEMSKSDSSSQLLSLRPSFNMAGNLHLQQMLPKSGSMQVDSSIIKRESQIGTVQGSDFNRIDSAAILSTRGSLSASLQASWESEKAFYKEAIYKVLFSTIGCGLSVLNGHRLSFLFFVVVQADIDAGSVQADELNLFTTTFSDDVSQKPPLILSATPQQWNSVCLLSNECIDRCPSLSDLQNKMRTSPESWDSFFNTDSDVYHEDLCRSLSIPMSLSLFQIIILIKNVRPDLLEEAIQIYVDDNPHFSMGEVTQPSKVLRSSDIQKFQEVESGLVSDGSDVEQEIKISEVGSDVRSLSVSQKMGESSVRIHTLPLKDGDSTFRKSIGGISTRFQSVFPLKGKLPSNRTTSESRSGLSSELQTMQSLKELLFPKGGASFVPILLTSVTPTDNSSGVVHTLERMAAYLGGCAVVLVPRENDVNGISNKIKKYSKGSESTSDMEGTWLLLQNCCNYTECEFSVLLRSLYDLRVHGHGNKTDERFRIFLDLSNGCPPTLPQSLVSTSYKIIIEEPASIRAHLRSAFEFGPLDPTRYSVQSTTGISMEISSASQSRAVTEKKNRSVYVKLLRVCTVFHAVLLYRRELSNVVYQFEEQPAWVSSELASLVTLLQTNYQSNSKADQDLWVVSHVLQDIIYGSCLTELEGDRLSQLFIYLLDLQTSSSYPEFAVPQCNDRAEHFRYAMSFPKSSEFTSQLYGLPIGVIKYQHNHKSNVLINNICNRDSDHHKSDDEVVHEAELDITSYTVRVKPAASTSKSTEMLTTDVPEVVQKSGKEIVIIENEIEVHNKQINKIMRALRKAREYNESDQMQTTAHMRSVPEGFLEALPTHFEPMAYKGAPLRCAIQVLYKRSCYFQSLADMTPVDRRRYIWLPAFTNPQAVVAAFTCRLSGYVGALADNVTDIEESGVISLMGVQLGSASWDAGTIALPSSSNDISPSLDIFILSDSVICQASTFTLEIPLVLSAVSYSALAGIKSKPKHCITLEFPSSYREDSLRRELTVGNPFLFASITE